MSDDENAVLTKRQLDELIRKIEQNHDAAIRNERILDRLVSVESSLGRLCSRMTKGLWGLISLLLMAIGLLMAAVWHIFDWVKFIIDHTQLVN